jgi:hypothetical protein
VQAYSEGLHWLSPKLPGPAPVTTYTGVDPIVQEYIRSAHFASFRQDVISHLQFGTPIPGGWLAYTWTER